MTETTPEWVVPVRISAIPAEVRTLVPDHQPV